MAIGGGCLVLALGGAALAVPRHDSLRIAPPRHAKKNVTYYFSVSGYAVKRERLYVFVDYQRCARAPGGEIRHPKNDRSEAMSHGQVPTVDSGGFVWKLNGKAHQKGPDHICAYLTRSAAVRAHAFATFVIH